MGEEERVCCGMMLDSRLLGEWGWGLSIKGRESIFLSIVRIYAFIDLKEPFQLIFTLSFLDNFICSS